MRIVVAFILTGIMCAAFVGCASMTRGFGPRIAPSAVFQLVCLDDDAAARVVVLTIDDGPDRDTTPRLLDVLARHGATATFFVIGERATPELLAMIADAGHELANHGWTEAPAASLGSDAFADSLHRTREVLALDPPALQAQGPQAPRWYRPGSGRYTRGMLELLDSRGYKIVLADVYPFDHIIASSGFHRWYVRRSVRNGSIVALHDAANRGRRTAETLDELLPQLDRLGYRVTSLDRAVEQFGCAVPQRR